MRFVVVGAGAIGGVVGGRLAQHDADVVLVARGAHLDAIAAHGLTIASPDDRTTVRVRAVGHPAEVDWRDRDVVVLAVKSHDTAAALDALAGHAPPDVPVCCAQNGVANERAALRRFSHVYGVCVMCPATHLEPGTVQAFAAPVSGGFDVGRYPRGCDETAEAVSAALRGATFSSHALPDVMRWKYAKLLMNLANAVEAVCTPGDGVAELVSRLVAEGRAALDAAGIPYASSEEDAARRAELSRPRPIDGARRGGGSSWQSLTRSLGSIEADYLNGEIVLLGRLHGVPTPANELVRRVAVEHARLRRPPQATPATELLAALP